MYTDVVGYSKLTGDNQEIALKILEEHNQILNKNTKLFSQCSKISWNPIDSQERERS